MRSSIIETRAEDYVATARAKGLTDGQVLRAHAFPNAMLPMVTLIAINLGYVVAGAITAEVVFNWPGLGTLTVDALSSRDYPVLQGVFLLLSITVVLANLVADLVYGVPRPAGSIMTSGTAAPTTRVLRSERWRLRLRNLRDFARRFAGRSDGRLGFVILAIFAVLAIAPQLFVGALETATTATGHSLEAPSATHLFGTDELGRDILNLTIHGARISMSIGLLATTITIFVGAVIGIVAGFIGGTTDNVLMRLTDFFLVLPTFVLAIILAPVILDIIGTGAEFFGMRATLLVIVVVIGVTSWATTARIIRSQTLSIRERMFVDRARVIGAGSGHIMRRHIFPNVVNLIVAQAVITFALAVFTETTLAFIGLGDPFAPSWGQILNAAQSAGAPGLEAWWYIAPPAICVVLVVLAFTLVGNALDDILNPKTGAADDR